MSWVASGLGESRVGGRRGAGLLVLTLGGLLIVVPGSARASTGSGQDQAAAKEERQKGKQAPETKGAPRSKAKEGAAAAGGVQGQPAAPLSFTDEDLRKFHRQVPVAEDRGTAGEEGAGADEAPAAGSRNPAPAAPEAATGLPGARPPVPAAPVASQDPLKPFKDREAKEKLRADQIQGLRDRIRCASW